MKYILTLIATLAIQTLNLQAQNVGFTYQAVAIDESKAEGFGQDSRGEILVNKNIGLRFSIHQSVSDGQVVYRESHETATDIFGIFRVIIGRGFNVSGSPLSDLEWGDIPYFLEVEVDLGNGFQYLGTEELLGSPYSLNKKQQLALDGNKLSITNGNHVTLLDNDPANELIQQFLLSGTELTIKDSGGIHTVNLAGLTTLNEAQVDALVSNNGFLTTEIDGSTTNELQTLTKSGNEISLSHNGGTVSIEDGDSNDQNEIQDLQLNGTVLSITNNGGATPIDFAGFINNISLTEQQVDDFANNNGYLTAESQDIATNGNPGNISIANGSEINLNVNDADASATNELQALELNGSVLSITNNPSATPVDFADLLADATLTEQQVDDYVNNNGYLTSETQDISTNGNPGNISIGNGSELSLNVDDDDADATNEIQDLQLTNNTLSITSNANASSIDLEPYLDAAFSTTNGVTSNAPGNYSTDDFVFGSPVLGYSGNLPFGVNHSNRMFFDKSKGAFRAGQALLSQWDDANVGELSFAVGSNTIASGQRSFAAGWYAIASGNTSFAWNDGEATGAHSIAMGSINTIASGNNSIALGAQAVASGSGAVAIGQTSSASDLSSFAIGFNSKALAQRAISIGNSRASAFAAFAVGESAVASGEYSSTIGMEIESRSYGETALGIYGTLKNPASINSFIATDPLFTIGNGTASFSRSDALVMLKNGNTRLHGQLTIDADNVNGGGESYTLPAQDGNANQVMTTDGNGIVSWTTPSNVLTEAEVDDFVSDNGFLASEVDGSVTNEIQDLTLTNNVLTITNNASATPIDLTVYENVFQTSNGITSNENGNYASDDFVFGSPTIDNAIQFNYASRMFFDKTRAAFRAGYVLGDRWNEANIGYASTAFGENTRAAGNRSFATGDNSTTYGENSASIGTGSVAWADRSLVFGTFVQGFSYNEIAIGSYNTSYTVSANGQNSWQPSDRLFVIGNGASGLAGAQSDALIMLKNGNTLLHGQLTIDADNVGGAGLSYTLPGQRGSNGQVMTTDGSGVVSWTSVPLSTFVTNASVTSNANGNYAVDDFVFGSSQLANSGNAIHNTRMFFDKSKGAFRAGHESGGGWNDANVGANSAAFGLSVTATGNSSFAAGAGVNAMGASAIAMGSNSNAFDQESVALGNSAHAYETRAFAIGSLVDAIGQNSFAIGYNVEASSYGETAMGIYGLQWGGSTNNFVPSDRLFSVGNGIDENNRSDAFVIYKNGDATLTGLLTQLSDAKLKKSVWNLKGSLSKLSLVRGVNYQWNGKKPQDTLALQTGFIAQEIETVFPELVNTDTQGFKSVNYIGLIPHLVEAIKSLKNENEQLKKENNQMKDSLKVSLLLMDAKITALEGLLTEASTLKK